MEDCGRQLDDAGGFLEANMRNRFFVFCALFVLLGVGLSCSLPGVEQTGEELIVTPAPTLAPSPLPPLENTPPPPSELVYEGGALKTSYGSADAFCSVTQAYTLRVDGNGMAKLTTTGPAIVDHYNCTASDAPETWVIEGVLSGDQSTLNFETCNDGRFTATGSLNLAGGNPTGTASCINKDGVLFISLQIGP